MLSVIMQTQNILYRKASFGFGKYPDGQLDYRIPITVSSLLCNKIHVKSCLKQVTSSSICKIAGVHLICISHTFQPGKVQGVADENQGELAEEDDELCPVECVKEFKTDEEFFKVVEKAKETNSLVVVDFFRTSCGSCKYIEQGFAKLCKGSGDEEASVIFLKHNVLDEYDEQSEVAERLRIKTVPLFHFYKNGVLLEAFATRDKDRIDAAIHKYTCADIHVSRDDA
ncbi:Thioredoxin domain-containing protein [Cephalotus follicularis]|uniref:Thioredoxin-like 4, chloroplastic n=1 Tax=Cephalotus follicularis TaxID=3775 RepID=A0A1Q3CDT8_CEPFO|nr:Thioredoxin domain-containing protein [Cephalotus follicularis]